MTDNATLVVVLTTVGTGAGALLGFLTFILRRKTDLRSVDRTSGATERDSQTRYIATLQSGELATREELAAYVRHSESERGVLIERLAESQGQLARVLRELAGVRTDFALSEARIDSLTTRIAGLLHRLPDENGPRP